MLILMVDLISKTRLTLYTHCTRPHIVHPSVFNFRTKRGVRVMYNQYWPGAVMPNDTQPSGHINLGRVPTNMYSLTFALEPTQHQPATPTRCICHSLAEFARPCGYHNCRPTSLQEAHDAANARMQWAHNAANARMQERIVAYASTSARDQEDRSPSI